MIKVLAQIARVLRAWCTRTVLRMNTHATIIIIMHARMTCQCYVYTYTIVYNIKIVGELRKQKRLNGQDFQQQGPQLQLSSWEHEKHGFNGTIADTRWWYWLITGIALGLWWKFRSIRCACVCVIVSASESASCNQQTANYLLTYHCPYQKDLLAQNTTTKKSIHYIDMNK